MAIYIGDIDITGLYMGDVPASAYVGSELIWPTTTPPTPTGGTYDVVYVEYGQTNTDTFSNGVIPNDEYRDRDITSVVIGDGITQIGEDDYSYVFAGCSSLTSVTIGSGVTYIGGRAFENTRNLHSITIPASVTGIGTNCFYNFENGDEITFESSTPINLSMNENGDLGMPWNGVVINVPCNALSDYEQAWPWYQNNFTCYNPGPVEPPFFEVIGTTLPQSPNMIPWSGGVYEIEVSANTSWMAQGDNYGDSLEQSLVTLTGSGYYENDHYEGQGPDTFYVVVGSRSGSSADSSFQIMLNDTDFESGDTISVEQEGYVEPAPVYSAMPLTFEVISAGTIVWKLGGSRTTETKTIEYKLNDGSWTSIASTTAGTSFNVSAGDIVEFRGNNNYYATSTAICSTFSSSTAIFNAYGNIASLIDSTGFTGVTAYTSTYTFACMFRNTNIVDASNLVLPATTLTGYCYDTMFENCYLLNALPALPADTLAEGCYRHMYTNCSGLTAVPYDYLSIPTTIPNKACSSMFRNTRIVTAPALPATTIGTDCYGAMFRDNPALTASPVLPALTVPNQAYQYMFTSCASITAITCLATTISGSSQTLGTFRWVQGISGVVGSGTFTKNANMSSWTTGDNGIPTGWTVQDAE